MCRCRNTTAGEYQSNTEGNKLEWRNTVLAMGNKS
jgi:hypothetical protein